MKDFLLGMLSVTVAAAIFVTSTLIYTKLTAPETVETLSDNLTDTPTYPLLEDVTVYDTVKGITLTYSIEDYLLYALLANISADYPDEVIKAQTVILYTYILTRHIAPNPDYNGADISTDTTGCLPLTIPENKYSPEVLCFKSLITDVLGIYITYNSEPIEPAFCIASGGSTVSAFDALGMDIPYLQSVDSSFEDDSVLALTYTKEELFARLSTCDKGINLYTEAEYWIDQIDFTPNGYVKSMRFCDGTSLTGRYVATILNLPSAKFTISYDSDACLFTVTTAGQGSLMGFSQSGAAKLAEAGYTWQQLLAYYYTDVEIVT